MGIKHSVTKVSGETGYATEWNADHVIDGDVECAQHEHKEHVIENRADWPAGPAEGQIIYRTDLKTSFVWNGTSWVGMLAIVKDTAGPPSTEELDGTFCVNTADNRIYVRTTPSTNPPDTSWWKFDEANGNATDSVSAHTATNHNAVTYVAGKYNNCSNFNGVNQYFTVASHADFNINGNFTWEFWLYLIDKTPAAHMVIFRRHTDDDNFYYCAITPDGHLQYYHEAQAAVSNGYISLDSVSTLEWHHYAIVGDRAGGTMKFYLDGELIDTFTLDGTAFVWGADPVSLGADDVGGAFLLEGRLDDLKLWLIARTQSEIQQDGMLSGTSAWTYVDLKPV